MDESVCEQISNFVDVSFISLLLRHGYKEVALFYKSQVNFNTMRQTHIKK